MASEGYKVPGKKMQSRFGLSHRAQRAMWKGFARSAQQPEHNRMSHHYSMLSKRRAKLCKHPHMRDDGYGGPESGCIDLHCPDCGYSHRVVLY